MRDFNDLIDEAQQIQGFLEISASDDPNELSFRLSEINVYMARSGNMLAEAKLLQDKAINAAYTEHSKSILKMPATIATKFINSVSVNENHLVTWIERINRTCVHQGDNIRTQISLAKEQLRLAKTGY